jgi:general stress protein YciG
MVNILGGNQGFASMDEDKQREVASKGGKAHSATNKAESTHAKLSRAGKKGAAAQPTEAKRRGGKNSHRNT